MPGEPFECPHCGAPVPKGRLACPECGSDAQTGWQSSEEIDYQSVELPEDSPGESRGPKWLAPLVVALLVTGFVLWSVLR